MTVSTTAITSARSTKEAEVGSRNSDIGDSGKSASSQRGVGGSKETGELAVDFFHRRRFPGGRQHDRATEVCGAGRAGHGLCWLDDLCQGLDQDIAVAILRAGCIHLVDTG